MYKTIVIAACIISFNSFANSSSPYEGQESRKIKALSQSEVTAYLNGKGLGYAKAAELNQFPGPKHVLEIANELQLTDEQSKLTQVLFATMKSEAAELGKQFITKEQKLNQLFANETITENNLNMLVSDIAELEAKIRFVHLQAHLEQKRLLTRQQINLYDQLRGYKSSHHDKHNHSH